MVGHLVNPPRRPFCELFMKVQAAKAAKAAK
jgi:hypothetical protein